jgi:ribose-phosphate pyrophosphokinase
MIKLNGAEYTKFTFPSGEINVKISNVNSSNIDITFDFERSEEIVELMLVVDAIKRYNSHRDLGLGKLYMRYVPFGRQDRVMQKGESLSIKVFCDLINSMGFTRVLIDDAHSSVTTSLLDNCLEFEQKDIFVKYLLDKEDFYLISADGGALKKIYKLAESVNTLGVIECSKERDVKTGQITRTVAHCYKDIVGKECVIVDDICDGGRTFIEIAKTLKIIGCGKITLCVTHGLFTKGLEVFDGLIEHIITNKGVVK